MSSSDSSSPLSGDPPMLSDGIVMVSLPDTQDDGKGTAVADVFHTPPEESSLPSSDLDICPVNHAVDADAGTQGFVDFCDAPDSLDLGKDSQLVEYPVKKSKLYDYDSGFVSSEDSQSEKVEEGLEKCKGKLVSENDGVVHDDKVACTVEVNKSSSEKHRKSDERTGVLPPSVRSRVENVTAGEGSSGEMNVFDVLRALTAMENDEDSYPSHFSLSDAARLNGITFSRPRWYQKNYNYNPYCKERKH